MRILFVHNFHQKFGGDDTLVENYIAMLRRRGHVAELYKRHNDEIIDFGLFQKIRFCVDAIFSLKTWRELKRLIQQVQPDLIFIHGIYPLISPSVYDLAWKYNVPVVQMVHDMRFWCPMAWFYRNGNICTLCAKGNFLHSIRYKCYRNSRLLSALYATSIALSRMRGYFKKNKLFIIPSEHIREYLTDRGVPPERIALHPHIVAAQKQSTAPLDRSERYVAFLGRLSPEKGLMTIMRAARQFPNIPFRIGGTGPMEEEIRSFAKKHNMSNVKLCGFLTGEDKSRFLREAALLVAPSKCYESFGQVVVEANSVGTPVIAANHGGLASLVVDRKTGWLFKPGDDQNFHDVLQAAWDDPELEQISHNALEYFETHLAEDRLIADLEQSLERVVIK